MSENTCKSKVLNFDSPLVMGILNITPDSFFDGGKYENEEAWINQAQKMINQGVDIIDLGAMSSRPGAEWISEEEEIERLLPVLKLLLKHFPEMLFSVDTFRAKIARLAVENGADIINDIYGGTADDQMASTIAELKVPYVMMHMKGDPINMQDNPIDKEIVAHVKKDLAIQIEKFKQAGAGDYLIIDPGFGFGKSVRSNYQLLNQLAEMKEFGYPVLVGLSRKSMINKILNTQPAEALNGTTVLNTLSLHNGADILRVHDVKEAVEVVRLFAAYKG